MSDTLTIVILPDGTIRTETDQISEANHASADSFIREIAILTAGEVTRAKRDQVAAAVVKVSAGQS